MKTIELASPEEVIAFLEHRVAQGDVLHGSPTLDLSELRPGITNHLHVHSDGNQPIVQDRLSATEAPAQAIFYGAVKKPVRDAGLLRGAGVRTLQDEQQNILGYEYFLSNHGKRLIAARSLAGIQSAVYFSPKEHFEYWPKVGEWRAHRTVPVIGSVAVTVDCLPFDVFSLAAPDSDQTIRAYYEKYGVSEET